MNCSCPVELHPEFGFDHPPAVSSPWSQWNSAWHPGSCVILQVLSPKSSLTCHWPPAQAVATSVSAQLSTAIRDALGPLTHAAGQYDPGFLAEPGEWWESWSSSFVTRPPRTEPSQAPATSTRQTEDTDQLQQLPPVRVWAEQAVLVPGKVLLCSEQELLCSTTIPRLSQPPRWDDSSTPLPPPG